MSLPETSVFAAPPPPATAPLAATAALNARPVTFDHREPDLLEWMDLPCTYADWAAGARHLSRVNRVLRAHAPTLRFLEAVVRARGVGYAPLHIVDAGCADADTLRVIARWAAQRSVPVRLTGIDMNPYAARAAAECARAAHLAPGAITILTADIFSATLPEPADVVLSALFTHHLLEPELIRFLRWQEQTARWGWMINDLHRSERAHNAFPWLARLLRWHPYIAHDGPVSIRRGFRSDDWTRLLRAAGMEPGAARIFHSFGARICVERLRASPLALG